MRPLEPPLFPQPLPFQRPQIAGWPIGASVAFPDPKAPSLERKGRVIATLPGFNALVLRCVGPAAIVEIAPERCRRIA